MYRDQLQLVIRPVMLRTLVTYATVQYDLNHCSTRRQALS